MALIGWRATFVVYAAFGVVWAWWFWHWYRDEPADHPSVSAEERLWMATWQAKVDEVGGKAAASWRSVLTNRSIWGLAGATFSVSFAWFFNATWLPTYLSEERHINLGQASWYASLPFVFGIAGCAVGGWVSDALVEALGGVRWARRAVGFAGSTLAGIFFLLSLRVTDPLQAVLVMGMAAFFNDMTLSSLWAACMDIGERDSGRVAGVVNTASGLGGFLSPMVFGELLAGIRLVPRPEPGGGLLPARRPLLARGRPDPDRRGGGRRCRVRMKMCRILSRSLRPLDGCPMAGRGPGEGPGRGRRGGVRRRPASGDATRSRRPSGRSPRP